MTIARALLFNRFGVAIIVFGMIVVVINTYAAMNDDGLLAGRVTDTHGKPVSGAQVILYMPALIGLEEIARDSTDADGSFGFREHGQHHPALQVRAEGYAISDLRRVRLYFRNQNRILENPIILSPVPDSG